MHIPSILARYKLFTIIYASYVRFLPICIHQDYVGMVALILFMFLCVYSYYGGLLVYI